jgi:transcription elongation factor Elf1
MSCDICGRGSCCESFHSIEEQFRYSKVVEAFDNAREMRAKVREEFEAEQKAQEDAQAQDEDT